MYFKITKGFFAEPELVGEIVSIDADYVPAQGVKARLIGTSEYITENTDGWVMVWPDDVEPTRIPYALTLAELIDYAQSGAVEIDPRYLLEAIEKDLRHRTLENVRELIANPVS